MFLLILSSDHISPATGKSPTVTISKAGGAFGAAAGTVTEVSGGWYKVALTTADTGTAGDLAFHVTEASSDNTDFCDQVGMDGSNSVTGGMSALPNTACTTNASLLTSGTGTDQLHVVSGVADANVKQLLGTAWLTPGTAGTPDVNAKLIGGQTAALDANNFLKVDVEDIRGTASPATAGYVGPDWGHVNAPTTVLDLSNTTIKNLDGNTVQTGDAYARLGAPAGASVSADVAAVKSDTAAVKTATNTGVAPGAAGGLFISGANTGPVSVTTVTGDALTLTSGHGNGLTATGAGVGGCGAALTGGGTAGMGLKAGGGTIGAAGIYAVGGSTSGPGIEAVGNVSGAGISIIGGTTGDGIDIVTTAGDGISILPTAGNAITATGNGGGKLDFNATTTALKLPSNGLANVTAWTVAITGNVTGNLSGSVGSVTAGVTLAASQHVIVDSGTVTTLTNLPAIPANWLTATGIAAAALNGKGDWSTYAGGDTSGTTTLLTRLSALRAGYLDNLSGGAVALESELVTVYGAVLAIPTNPYTGTPPTAAAIATACAAAILVTPAQLLYTDATGRVTALDSTGAAFTYVTPSNPTDYQQRGVAVTLPANPPAGFLVTASYGTAPAWYTSPVDVSANVAAIKAKTDQLTFTVSLHVDATASVGNVTVGGYAAGQDPATLVLDVMQAGHNTPGTIGHDIGAAGAAADPLANPVPGSYPSGTAGWVLGQLLSHSVTYAGPVNPTTGAVTLVRGDDYRASDGRALSFALSTGSGNPDLTGATVAAFFRGAGAATPFTCAVVSPGGPSQSVTLELTAAQTATLTAGRYTLALVALLADGHSWTLAYLNATVL